MSDLHHGTVRCRPLPGGGIEASVWLGVLRGRRNLILDATGHPVGGTVAFNSPLAHRLEAEAQASLTHRRP